MQTADQINAPQTGQVTTATFPPTVNITPKPNNPTAQGWTGGMLKGNRESVLNALAESGLTESEKALLIEKVGKVEGDLIQVHFHQHSFNGGTNGGWTVIPL